MSERLYKVSHVKRSKNKYQRAIFLFYFMSFKNRNKKVVYRTFVTNSYHIIGVGNSFNALNREAYFLEVCFLVPLIAHCFYTQVSIWSQPMEITI
jgi:hypothetical protein